MVRISTRMLKKKFHANKENTIKGQIAILIFPGTKDPIGSSGL